METYNGIYLQGHAVGRNIFRVLRGQLLTVPVGTRKDGQVDGSVISMGQRPARILNGKIFGSKAGVDTNQRHPEFL